MPDSTTYVSEPRDDDRLRRYVDRYRDAGELVGPPIVVHSDPETQKRWVVSDPHRHAAATRAGVEVPTVELREVFREAGRDYDQELARAREEGRGHPGGIIAEQIFTGSREWVDRLIRTLPDEVQRRYWTES
jgi:hypothetical protein